MRRLDLLNVALLVPIGVVHLLQSRGLDAGWFTMYGADLFGTAWVWWLLRRTVFLRCPAAAEVTVGVVLILGITWEVCQRYDLSGTLLARTRGTYDGWDIVVYAVTLAACYGLERRLRAGVLAAGGAAGGEY